MTNNQGYGVWWDDVDIILGQVKRHRYFNTVHGADTFMRLLEVTGVATNIKVMKRELISDEQMTTAERALNQKLNRDELTQLMLEYSFTIRAKDFANWRPTRRVKGNVPGVWEIVELIATDGLLGIFLNDQREPTYGHIQMFDGEVKTLYPLDEDKTNKPKKEKKLSKRQQFLQSI